MKAKVVFVALVLSFLLVSPVLAQGVPYSLPNQAQVPAQTPTPRSGLGRGVLQACQAIESAVKNRMESLVGLATNIERVFDLIATRVETFYTDKIVPSGKTVANYNALVSDISTKKGVVDTDLAAAQTLVSSFSCTAGDPRGLLTQFRVDMQKVKSDLQAYRTSIKNLIVAVRSVAPSPKPSESPEASPSK